jgi:hypothetical protein
VPGDAGAQIHAMELPRSLRDPPIEWLPRAREPLLGILEILGQLDLNHDEVAGAGWGQPEC